jgi:hypothetical protein
VAVGFAMSFSPYAFELILAIVFVGVAIFKQINKYYFYWDIKETKTCTIFNK